MQLVVIVETRTGMLEFDFCVEDDVVGNRIGRQQHHARRIESILPLTVGGGILHGAELDLAVSPNAQSRHGRGRKTQYRLVRRIGRNIDRLRLWRGLARGALCWVRRHLGAGVLFQIRSGRLGQLFGGGGRLVGKGGLLLGSGSLLLLEFGLQRLDASLHRLQLFHQGFVRIAVRRPSATRADDGHRGCCEQRVSPATSVQVEYRYRQAQKLTQRHRAPHLRRSKAPRHAGHLTPLQNTFGIRKWGARLESLQIRIRIKPKYES